jgi:hypothetical protein
MAAVRFSEVDLLNIACNTARAMPVVIVDGVSQPCKTINTVAHLRLARELFNTDNLGKDARIIGKNLFFSRVWEALGQSPNDIKWAYPAVAIGSISETRVKRGTTNMVYNFSIIDQRRPQQKAVSENYDHCAQRTDEEIEDDLRTLFARFFDTLREHVYADGYDVSSNLVFSGWATPSALDAQPGIVRWVKKFAVASVVAEGYESQISYDDFAAQTVGLFSRVNITLLECSSTFPVLPDNAYQLTQISPCCP